LYFTEDWAAAITLENEILLGTANGPPCIGIRPRKVVSLSTRSLMSLPATTIAIPATSKQIIPHTTIPRAATSRTRVGVEMVVT
jgi:hypothetical protein